ncbi:hypothetical protein PRIPAC_84701 [Pristionchus pacificus]|uniref:Uncharacterized protein n=1 Tax=Pristionchus pacificus TaxID=54126 RepID=A0A2A6BMF2_PRIPA|nr:hypothetical protein PRIPAC_84701 [Pristionchus pacificus]|eukprot:PDM67104.1 hypothetical protein PRIPAC_48521 [Pristionchus pacificus]
MERVDTEDSSWSGADSFIASKDDSQVQGITRPKDSPKRKMNEPAMFYACMAILVLFSIMCLCVTLAAIDLELYNFGLYIVLLCIVGTMLACALCIANPNACPNPLWYTRFCLLMHEMYPVPEPGSASPKMNGLRSRMIAMQQQQAQSMASSTHGDETRQESRATVAMLAPAVHIMHQVWKGMAWVTDGIEDEEEVTRSGFDPENQCHSSELSDPAANKRLSTIAESSCSIVRELSQQELEQLSRASSNSMNDIIV